jgi:hypothetical protein
VTLARELARRGLWALRLDFSGLGDSPPRRDALPFAEASRREVMAAMDHLERTHGVRRFVPAGLCSGGDAALRVAASDPRVAGAVVVNGTFEGMLAGSPASRASLEAQADVETRMRYYRKKMWNPGSLVRLVTFRTNYRMLGKTLARTLGRRVFGRSSRAPLPAPAVSGPASGRSPLRGDFKLLAVFSEGSTSLDLVRAAFGKEWRELPRRFPAVTLEVVDGVDHVFTPLRAQEHLIRLVGDWVDQLQ